MARLGAVPGDWVSVIGAAGPGMQDHPFDPISPPFGWSDPDLALIEHCRVGWGGGSGP